MTLHNPTTVGGKTEPNGTGRKADSQTSSEKHLSDICGNRPHNCQKHNMREADCLCCDNTCHAGITKRKHERILRLRPHDPKKTGGEVAYCREQQKELREEKKRLIVKCIDSGRKVMSYTEARSHFENAKNSTADATLIEIANGLKHFSHAIEEDIRTLEQDIRSLQNQRGGSS